MSDHLEVEDTYDVPEDATLPDLHGLPGVASVERVEDRLVARYFDTEDLALAALGITLRRRTGGSDAGWHLKVPSAPAGKLEVQLPLGRAVRTVPKPLRELLQGLTRGQALSVVSTVSTHRATSYLRDDDGQVLAEVCDDRVTAETVGLVAATTESTWREWEVELVSGDRALARAAAERLGAAGARPAAIDSKLQRALGSRLPRRPVTPSSLPPDATAQEVVAARLAQQATRILRLDPLVRHDAPDAVHQMRVAVRRLRSALATFRPLLAREVTDPVREELQWLGQTLSDARDIEVLRERWCEELSRLPDEPVAESFERWMVQRLDEAYDEAHAHGASTMATPRHRALLAALDRLRTDPPWADTDGTPDDELLRRRVRKDWTRVRRAVEAAAAEEDPARRAALLHEARKKAKRLRYAAETLRPLNGEDALRLATAAERVQSALGTVQDSVVGRQELARMTPAAHESGVPTFAAGVLHAREEDAERSGRDQFDRAWRRLRRKRVRAWLR